MVLRLLAIKPFPIAVACSTHFLECQVVIPRAVVSGQVLRDTHAQGSDGLFLNIIFWPFPSFGSMQLAVILSVAFRSHMSSVQIPCWLMIIGDYTTQYIGDYNNPIGESL